MGLKFLCSTEVREMTLGSTQRVVKKGQRNRRFEKFGIPLYLYGATEESKFNTEALVYRKPRRLSSS